LPYEEPEEQKAEDIEVVDEEQIESDDNDIGTKNDSSDQTTLF
jgi:topoisomerase-4 subunit A